MTRQSSRISGEQVMKELFSIVLAAAILICLINVGNSNDAGKDETRIQLKAMEIKREEMRQSYGPNHPSVKQINHQIQLLKKHVGIATDIQKDVQELNDNDLRKLVGHLAVRIQKLEREVEQLKERKPKVELLSN